MKKLFYLSGIVFLMFLFGCSKQDGQLQTPDSNDNITLKKADKFKPFHATFEVSVDMSSVRERKKGQIIPDDPPYPPTFPPPIPFMKYQDVYGDGNATHLGKTDVKLEQWWRPMLNPPPPLEGEPFHVWSGTGCGEIYFTAANGDILLADYNGALAVHLTTEYVETTLTGNFKDGGSGRFKNAEGEFLWEVKFYPLDNYGTVSVTGEIKYSK